MQLRILSPQEQEGVNKLYREVVVENDRLEQVDDAEVESLGLDMRVGQLQVLGVALHTLPADVVAAQLLAEQGDGGH